MTALSLLVIFGILDLVAPTLLRVSGLNEFPQQPDDLRAFRRDIGYVRLPRTAFLVLGSGMIGLIDVRGMELIGVVAGFSLMIAWMAALVWDLLRARRNWLTGTRS